MAALGTYFNANGRLGASLKPADGIFVSASSFTGALDIHLILVLILVVL
jgi:hypothetical protein